MATLNNKQLTQDDVDAVNAFLEWQRLAREFGFEQAGFTIDLAAGGLRCTAWLHHGRECRPVIGSARPTVGAAIRSCLEKAPNLGELLTALDKLSNQPTLDESVEDVTRCIGA